MNYLIVSMCACFSFGLGCGIYILRDFGIDGVVAGIAPAFLHSLAFALAGWLLFDRRILVQVWCVSLAMIGIGFELAQNVLLPDWLPSALREYSANGVFDPFDIVATALGFFCWICTYWMAAGYLYILWCRQWHGTL